MHPLQFSSLVVSILLVTAGAVVLLIALHALVALFRDLLASLRPYEEPELGSGPFNLRSSDSELRARHLRRHQVQVRGHWWSGGKWTSRSRFGG